MKQTITESQFVNEVVGDEYNNMSYEGAKALFEYLDECYGDNCTFDRVEIRCDFAEYSNLEDILKDYSDIETLEDLYNNTIVIEIPDTNRLIIAPF